MATVVEIRGKTEQRVTAVIEVLKTATQPVTYDDLIAETGSAYDSLLYILETLRAVGLVERLDLDTPRKVPGRPRVRFSWVSRGNARALGARSA